MRSFLPHVLLCLSLALTGREGGSSLSAPGAPDFQTRYSEDRNPTGSKVVAWRKMAYDVCGTMVAREADLPTITTGNPEVRARARTLWVLAANGSTTDAWTGACAGLLSSIKFLSY